MYVPWYMGQSLNYRCLFWHKKWVAVF
uniref:Uncharacterized protein n=1 Tax=Arundo donax TaxID=35708 RepID=A0A0A8ZVJ3_ARUDO